MTVTDSICEVLTMKYFDDKAQANQSDEDFLNLIAKGSVPRYAVSEFFKLCVLRKEMIPLKSMSENVLKEIRLFVVGRELDITQCTELANCCALIKQLNGIE